jgi:hypothetical protein
MHASHESSILVLVNQGVAEVWAPIISLHSRQQPRNFSSTPVCDRASGTALKKNVIDIQDIRRSIDSILFSILPGK